MQTQAQPSQRACPWVRALVPADLDSVVQLDAALSRKARPAISSSGWTARSNILHTPLASGGTGGWPIDRVSAGENRRRRVWRVTADGDTGNHLGGP